MPVAFTKDVYRSKQTGNQVTANLPNQASSSSESSQDEAGILHVDVPEVSLRDLHKVLSLKANMQSFTASHLKHSFALHAIKPEEVFDEVLCRTILLCGMSYQCPNAQYCT